MIKLIALSAVLTILILNGCAKTEPEADIESNTISSKVALTSTHELRTKTSEQPHSITPNPISPSCENLNINTLTGFTEGTAEASCQPVRNFHLTQFKCDISKNAFAAERDAIVLKTEQLAVFAYTSAKDCQHAVEIRNANE